MSFDKINTIINNQISPLSGAIIPPLLDNNTTREPLLQELFFSLGQLFFDILIDFKVVFKHGSGSENSNY